MYCPASSTPTLDVTNVPSVSPDIRLLHYQVLSARKQN